MNSELFRSMQEQLSPSEGAAEGLREKLENSSPVRRSRPWLKYGALAACAALVIAAFPMYHVLQPPTDLDKRPLHSYTLTGAAQTITTASDTSPELNQVERGGGEESPAPAPDPGGEIGQQDPLSFVSQSEAIGLYDQLITHFYETYGRGANFDPNWPDWYGGGYLDNDRSDNVARLNLVLVEDLDTPALRQEIIDILGSKKVDFVSGRYALSYLRDLQDSLLDYPVIREVFAGSGVDEEENRIHLELVEVTDEALLLLAELDPDDDAIYVTAGQRATVTMDASRSDVDGTVSVSHEIETPADDPVEIDTAYAVEMPSPRPIVPDVPIEEEQLAQTKLADAEEFRSTQAYSPQSEIPCGAREAD